MLKQNRWWLPVACMVVLSATSCVETDEDVHEGTGTHRAPIVFNDRNVEQIREEVWEASRAQTASPPEPDDAARHLEAALAANATGLVEIADFLDEECVKDPDSSRFGSGVLSSSTRMLTAHHVVFPRDGTDTIRVGFGGHCDSAVDCEGTMRQMRASEPPDAENPLLANRLFGLSLHAWAQKVGNAPDKRNELRTGWGFEVDTQS